MPAICLYFQAHQPFRLKNVSFFELGDYPEIENKKSNKHYLRLALRRSYMPVMHILNNLLQYSGSFKFAVSYTGTLLQQIRDYYPASLDIFREVTQDHRVELISECYYHSLAYFYSQHEFISQVYMHKDILEETFGKEGTVFRNSELAYRSDLAKVLNKLGFRGIIIEGCHRVLKTRSPNYLYFDNKDRDFRLLLRSRKYSGMFSEFHPSGKTDPVKLAVSLAGELNDLGDDLVVLGFDMENLGEHHAAHTGVFRFFRQFVRQILKQHNTQFILPSEAIAKFRPAGGIDIYSPVTWNGTNRDLSAWNGNIMQQEALKNLYSMEEKIKETRDPQLLENWRKLQSTDHLLYLATDERINGKDIQYFSPYASPHDAYIAYMNAISSLEIYANKVLARSNLFFSGS